MAPGIVFVCTGNICRSPVAEVLARKMFFGLDLEFTSAGLSALDGHGASSGSCAFVQGEGASLELHRSQPVNAQLLDRCAWVIGMTRSHAALVRSRFGGDYKGCIGILGAPGFDLATCSHSPECREVDDPYGLPQEAYQTTGRLIRELLLDWKPVFEDLAAKAAGGEAG